jgi:sulfonate transport system permease protein
MKRLLLSFLFFAGLLLLWETITRLRIWSPVLLPAPLKVVEYLNPRRPTGTLWQAIWITVKRLVIGYLIGLIGGVPLGLLTARWRVLHDTIGTRALGLQTLPSVC